MTKCLMFLMALNGMSLTDIAEKFDMTKSEVHEIIQKKLEEHHAGDWTISRIRSFPVWKNSIIEKELTKLWEML